MKKILVLILSLGLVGCATTANYEAKLNTWIGATEDSLIASWGVPNKTYDLKSGKKAVSFIRKDTVRRGGYPYTVSQTSYQTGTIGGQAYEGRSTEYVTETMPVERYKIFCETSFVLDASGKVESWHHEGNNCVSP